MALNFKERQREKCQDGCKRSGNGVISIDLGLISQCDAI